MVKFCIISHHRHGEGRWNSCSWKKRKDLPILYSQYYSRWCPCDTSSKNSLILQESVVVTILLTNDSTAFKWSCAPIGLWQHHVIPCNTWSRVCSHITDQLCMIMEYSFSTVWNKWKLLVAQRTTSGEMLSRPVNIEWFVEVMCCAHLTIIAFVDMI